MDILNNLTTYLGITPQTLNNMEKRLYNNIIAAIKKTITRHWLPPQIPTIPDWTNITNDIHDMEKRTATIRLKLDLFVNTRTKWTSYIIQQNPPEQKTTEDQTSDHGTTKDIKEAHWKKDNAPG